MHIYDAYGVSTVRALEERAFERVGADALMQRAAHALATIAAREAIRLTGGVYGAGVLVLVGPGNNGGDALFAGARLARRGARVTAVRCLGTPHQSGLAALRAAGGRLVDLDALGLDPDARLQSRPGSALMLAVDLVLDGVLGIGGRPGLPASVGLLAGACRDWRLPTIAVDLPSGVAADTGAMPGAAFSADLTVTFGEAKPCHLVEPARSRCGEVELVDIGLGVPDEHALGGLWLRQLDEEELAARWPVPDASSDKYSRGVVGIDTGSDTYPGAGVLSTIGAVYAGAGMVRFVGAEVPAQIIRQRVPNVVFSPGRVQANLVGSGWGDRPDGAELLARLLAEGLPTVVDADGLRYLPERVPATWLLTPHAGELARLLGEERAWVTDDPARAVRAAVARTGATVLLKGATQLVAAPDQPWIDVALPGPGWTGQAGSGDVLGGFCATLLAAGLTAAHAGGMAASLQALTAARHPGPIPPQRLAELAPGEIGRLQQRREAQLHEFQGVGA
jgi:ADP-dependent NAD(P)H-hydrate dehydratase / NAD(P)H-hydrate epimerase